MSRVTLLSCYAGVRSSEVANASSASVRSRLRRIPDSKFTQLTDGLDDPGEINLLSHFAELYLNIDVAHQFPRT